MLTEPGTICLALFRIALVELEAAARDRGLKPIEARVQEEHARIALVKGDQLNWKGRLHDAFNVYTRMGATGHAERIARELAA